MAFVIHISKRQKIPMCTFQYNLLHNYHYYGVNKNGGRQRHDGSNSRVGGCGLKSAPFSSIQDLPLNGCSIAEATCGNKFLWLHCSHSNTV